MNEDDRHAIALLRLAVLGDLIHTNLKPGEQKRLLADRAERTWELPDGSSRQYSHRTIEAWLYAYRRKGFSGLMPAERRDKGATRVLTDEVQELVLAMKREDPGRSVPLIIRELEGNGAVSRGELKPTVLRRLLRSKGLSGPQMKVVAAERRRFVAESCNGLWQGDACHGPKLFDPSQGRAVRAKIFGLIDDKSRLVTHLLASFTERQEDFLRLLHDSVRRRGVPRAILLDNHGSFTGSDVRITCAHLGIRLTYARPRDGQSKGKIERLLAHATRPCPRSTPAWRRRDARRSEPAALHVGPLGLQRPAPRGCRRANAALGLRGGRGPRGHLVRRGFRGARGAVRRPHRAQGSGGRNLQRRGRCLRGAPALPRTQGDAALRRAQAGGVLDRGR